MKRAGEAGNGNRLEKSRRGWQREEAKSRKVGKRERLENNQDSGEVCTRLRLRRGAGWPAKGRDWGWQKGKD